MAGWPFGKMERFHWRSDKCTLQTEGNAGQQISVNKVDRLKESGTRTLRSRTGSKVGSQQFMAKWQDGHLAEWRDSMDGEISALCRWSEMPGTDSNQQS
ncbi:hypothetical protein Nepgr_013719 [Nepenthes gracilis]|uniref:Uncharacterized protein n=1 Tax=Nepenthes gracilis TaxID=150966 RepID=A0AAD3XP83_NEPGR|nr:hypothetical protein Nepgr_013719 [Nepenthes gracilis]